MTAHEVNGHVGSLSDTSKEKQSQEQYEDTARVESLIPNEIDPNLSKRLDRKFDLHIIPWLFGIWLLAFIDRSNIGNAKIDGLTEDLHLVGNKFNIALVVFYVPYILVDVPSNWLVKRVKGGVYLPILITLWGLTCTFVGFTKSFGGLVAGRFFLGAFEGGLLGGIVVYLAMFYRRHEMVWRIGLFYCAAPLSGAFGGLLATGLAQIKYNGYNRWPWIFFIEGIITTLFGITSFFFMPNTPSDAKFLSNEERTLALKRMRMDAHGASSDDDVNDEKFDWHWVRMALLAPQTYLSSLAWFFLLVSLYSFSLFLPAIVRGMGYTATVAQLFTVPPNIVAFVLVLLTSTLSDRYRFRGPVMAVGAIIAAMGYVMLLASKRTGVRYGGTFLVASGVYPGSAMVMGWLSNNLAPHYVRATGTGFLISFANCAAFVATFIYLDKDAPDYKLGHSISLGSLILCAVTCVVQMLYLRWENARRDDGHREDRRSWDESRLGHRHPDFRYTL